MKTAQKNLSYICHAAAAASAAVILAPAPTGAASLQNDPEMVMFRDMLGQGFSFVMTICVALAIIYWIVACVKYIAEDSDEGARKHILRAAAGIFVTVSARKLISFILGNYFPGGLEADVPTGQAALKAVMIMLGKSITFVLTVAIVLAATYWVVMAIKMVSADNQETARRQLMRAAIGLFLIITARTLLSWALGVFG